MRRFNRNRLNLQIPSPNNIPIEANTHLAFPFIRFIKFYRFIYQPILSFHNLSCNFLSWLNSIMEKENC